MITLLVSLASAGECTVPTPCATGHAFHVDRDALVDPDCASVLPIRRAPIATPARRRGLEKQTRDSYGEFPNAYESDNFIIKWGINDRRIDDFAVQRFSDALEASWDVFIDEWGYDMPASADAYKFNVYIGNTGSGTPDDLGAGGYYWTDDDGLPMVVVNQDSLNDPGFLTTLASHEFFHAIQDANGLFAYDEISGWWWETTAIWVEHQVFPEADGWPVFLYWFAIRPELSVGHFEYPTTGTPEQFHQYGAFVYVEHVAQRHGGPELVYQSFDRSDGTNTPMQVLEELIRENGGDIEASFGEFTLRNGTWDYPTEDWFEDWIDAYGGLDASNSHRTAGVILTETDTPESEGQHPPRTYGANYFELIDPSDSFEITFNGDQDVTWHVGVSTQTGTTHDQFTMDITDTSGTLVVDGLDGARETWIVVAPTGPLADDGTEYTFTLEVTNLIEDGPGNGDDGPKSCGCTSAPGPGFLLFATPLLIGLRRRR